MVDLEPLSPHLRIVEDDALDLLFHPDRWWGGWDLNPRSPVPETGIFYARMGILDQAAPTQGWSSDEMFKENAESSSPSKVQLAHFVSYQLLRLV